MIRVAALPIRQDDRFRPGCADLFSQCEAILNRSGETRIAKIQPFAKARTDHRPSGFSLLGANFGGTARSHLALGEVQNAYGIPGIEHFHQRTRARQFDVIRMGGDGQDIDGFHSFLTLLSSSASSTKYLKAFFPLMNTTGTCSP